MDATNYTITDLANMEREMVLHAEEKYGEYFTHAANMVTTMNNLVVSINKPTRFLFIAFLSQVKKHLTLALFAATRRHHVDAGMNLRQMLEGSAWAAYAIAHENIDLFQIQNPNGQIEVPDRLEKARNTWLEANYLQKSEEIKRLKKQINGSVAHAKITYAFQTFALSPAGVRGFITSFFDDEDDFRVTADLLMVANFAMGMIDLFVGVNKRENVFQLAKGFDEKFGSLVEQHSRLRDGLKKHPRFQSFVLEPPNARGKTP